MWLIVNQIQLYVSSYIPIGTSKVHYKCMMIDCELDSHIPKQVHAGFSLALQNPNHNNPPYKIDDLQIKSQVTLALFSKKNKRASHAVSL